ncbi:MAG: Alpha/Beta hydrolase protein [Monoraphidium minutum]|nr:MAG: Alpha/Beta hydrolase protein [Monoraphidium minutum]
MEELVVPKGYPLEAYEVTTEDGYILALYRIPHGRYRNTQRGPKPIVFLQHGVTLASSSFVVLNANESLAFVLADAGFDVWMGNTRGNVYSSGHVTLSRFEDEFWQFGIDQLALIDLPTKIDFILAKTGATKMAFVGHSQGCTLAFMLLSAIPEYNDKISVVNHMGPVVFVDELVAPFLRLAPSINLDQVLTVLNIPEFLPLRLTAPVIQNLCDTYPQDEICAALVSFFFFGPSQYITPDDYLVIWRTWPSGVSTRNLQHWAQMFRDRRLELTAFDYGDLCNRTKWIPGQGLQPHPMKESCNLAEYGTERPPAYDITRIRTPMAFFLAEYDVLTVSQDVAEQYRRLPNNVTVAEFIYAGYGHMDFVWDRNRRHAADIADVMWRYAPGTY